MTQPQQHRGYIALISVLAISFMLMTFAILAGENGFRTRVNTTALEDRLAAAHHVRACGSLAFLLLAQDERYQPGSASTTIWLSPDEVCAIEDAVESGTKAVINASARVDASMSRVHAEAVFASTSAITMTKWSEI